MLFTAVSLSLSGSLRSTSCAVGRTLLALTVALVNAANGQMALYMHLTSVVLFLMYPVRYAYRWLTWCTGSLETGQSTTLMTVTLLIAFSPALCVYAIFDVLDNFFHG